MKSILPKKISIFPLRGAVFFPKTNLPLNIFEDRYLSMVEDALKNDCKSYYKKEVRNFLG